MKIDWKRKLTSRKFWAAIIAFVTSLLFAFNFADTDVTKITGVIMAGATVIAYIIGEGLTDAASAKPDTKPETLYINEAEEGDYDDEE